MTANNGRHFFFVYIRKMGIPSKDSHYISWFVLN